MVMSCVRLPTGWSPGRNEGESELEATRRLLVEYPGTTGIRKFFSTATVSATSGGLAAPIEEGTRVALSVPGTSPATGLDRLVDDLIGRGLCVDLIREHEPEKKTTPENLLAAYRDLDRQFPRDTAARLAGWLRLVVVMTVQRARVFAPEDLRRFITPDMARVVDVLGWDWYPSYDVKDRIDRYEDPEEAFALMLDLREESGIPEYGFYEIHHGRVMRPEFAVDLDPTGELCARWMREAYAFNAENGCSFWAHFHTSGGRLTTPAAVRAPEYDALQDMITLSASSDGEVDESHPQYVLGYEAGRAVGELAGRRQMADRVAEFVARERP